jgi:hypothetical protein
LITVNKRLDSQIGALLWIFLIRTLEVLTVQADKVKTSFKNGILEVRLPETEGAKTKGVKVKID